MVRLAVILLQCSHAQEDKSKFRNLSWEREMALVVWLEVCNCVLEIWRPQFQEIRFLDIIKWVLVFSSRGFYWIEFVFSAKCVSHNIIYICFFYLWVVVNTRQIHILAASKLWIWMDEWSCYYVWESRWSAEERKREKKNERKKIAL